MKGVMARINPYKKEPIFYKQNYSSVSAGELLCLIDSVDLLEIAVRGGSAAERLKAQPGDKVVLKAKK
ncbi:SAM-dependent chlorinase/fluorinase [bacterium]|nr:SAM-dependent chlorinase/fluorinase [bacterium]